MRSLFSALLLTLLSVAGAARVILVPGQTAQLGNQTVTVLRVQDSRCPINARCIQAGELKASVLVIQGKTSRSRLLTLTLPEKPGTAWAGLRLASATEVEIGKKAPLRLTLTDEHP
ncbi:hypothetical protein [Deinococcus hopiensis]|uniref:Uncharacterized protein n=1 Tax=Deinococcus hopiensis KR-140 TaxID=695939 RepID=A0A1W1V8D4_9DEIO|nr:hypothetical protein [Deinococcus hopiensis]SMB89264.1 hypothetical protein SAMN00790413_00340 [Deinococcus hopiensis KR-140]